MSVTEPRDGPSSLDVSLVEPLAVGIDVEDVSIVTMLLAVYAGCNPL